jgi:glycosyltransferase involved in cell wall biosynthesis
MVKSLENRKFLKNIISKMFLRRFVNSASVIHVTDEVEFEDLKKYGYKGRIKIIPHGVGILDITSFEPEYDLGFEFDVNKKYILYMSRIHPRKGLLKLVNAFINDEFHRDDVEVLVAGPVEDEVYFNELKEIISLNCMESKFHWLGHVTGHKKINILLISHVFVLPSDFENFGMAIAESLGAGLPVIIGLNNPWGDVEQFGIGKAVDLSTKNIVQAVNLYLDDDLDRLEVSDRCKRYISGKASWSSVSNGILDMYKEVLNDK